MTGSEVPEISVVLAYGGNHAALMRCLSAIRDSSVRYALIVVCTNDEKDALSIGNEDVSFVTTSSTDIGRQRALGMRASRAPLVAVTRHDTVPASGWLRHFFEAHRAHDVAAIGGPVIAAVNAGPGALAEYLSEYSRFASKVANEQATDLAATNVCYRRDALPLEAIAGAGYEELSLHARLLREGKRLRYDPAVPVFVADSQKITTYLRRRFKFSRSFAQRRTEGASLGRRLIWTLGSPLLPSLLIARTTAGALRNGQERDLLRAFPLVALFHLAAGFAEGLGYAESFLPGKERL